MSADFHFLRPLWFVLLVPLLVVVWWSTRRNAQSGLWSRVCDAALLPFIVQDSVTDVKNRAAWLLIAAGAVAITALAGPVWERVPTPVSRSDSALVIALDLSSSMTAADIKPSRLARAKYKIQDLLRGRKTGQTALLVFAAQSFVVTPLTTDAHTISAQLQALDTSIMPSQGSEPASALELAGKLLQQAGMPDGDVLLITDGADADAMARASDIAQAANFRLSVLGIGSRDGAPIPDADGGFAKADNGTVVLTRLDSAALQALTTSGRGVYLDSRADDSDVSAFNRYFDGQYAAHAQRMENLASSQWYEFGPWLLLPLLPLAALAFRRGVLVWFAALIVAGMSPPPAAADWWRTPDQRGQKAFQAQDYEAAALDFENPAWRAAARYRKGDFAGVIADLKDNNNAQAHYNRGNALARQGQFAAAVAAYDEALKRAPDDGDTKFNKALVKKQLDEQQQKQQSQPGQSNKPDRNSSSERSEAQTNPGKGEASERDKNERAQNASGGAPSQNNQDSDNPGDTGQGRSPPRNKPASSDADEDKDDDETAQQAGPPEPQDDPATAEKLRATEQWLEQIPDDPAGLLKRKFELQYKQMYGDKPNEGDPW